MITKKRSFFIGVLGALCIMILVFFSLSDLNKAKVTLKLLGVKKADFTEISNLILGNKFSKFELLEDVTERDERLLVDYYNQEYGNSNKEKLLNVSEIYGERDENWNKAGISYQKFEYLYSSENAIIICSEVGGCATSNWYEFYVVESNKIESIGRFSLLSPEMFVLALNLRFNEDMVEWNSWYTESLEGSLK